MKWDYQIFFAKQIKREIDLGDDIIDQSMKIKHCDNYHKDLLDKFGIDLHAMTFYEKQVYRKQIIWVDYSIRIDILKEGYRKEREIAYFSRACLSKIKINDYYKNWDGKTWRIADFTIDAFQTIMEEIELNIAFQTKYIDDAVDNLILELRDEMKQTIQKYIKTKYSQFALQYLIGALEQFDAIMGNKMELETSSRLMNFKAKEDEKNV